MAVGVGINNLGNTSVANTNDLFIIGVYSESDDGQGNIVVSYDTQGITYSNLRTNLDFVDLGDISVTEVAGVYGTDTSLEYDANTGGLTYTKPYILSNTEIQGLITAEDAKITVTNGVVGLGAVSTTDITEGDNLFYTGARATSAARAAISVSGSLAYSSATGVVSYTERTDDEVRGLFSGETGVTFDDTTGEISIGQDVSTTANVTFDGVTVSTLTGNGVYIDNRIIKLSNTGSNWVGIINQQASSGSQKLVIGSGDNLTGTGVVPQGGYTAWYGKSDTSGHAGEVRNNVWDTSINSAKTAGGFYANGQMWSGFGADITGDMTVTGSIVGTLDGTASSVASISNFSTNNLSEGEDNLYFTNDRVITALGGANTNVISEGSTNLYYRDSRVDSRIQSTSINSLSDVDTTTGLDQGDILSWDGGNWIPVAANDNLPIGTVQWYAGTSANIPAGWLECNGAEVTSTYPTLKLFLLNAGSPFGIQNSNPLLPDLRGRFARGYDPSATNAPYAAVVGAYQTDAFKAHNHGAGTLQTAEAGAHTHVVGGNDGDNVGSQKLAPYLRRDDAEFDSTDPGSIRTAGAHTHTLTGSTANAPTSGDGNETRPMNISFIPIIKAWGAILGSEDLGVADIANLLNNVASQSEAETGTNNTKFMSPLRTRQAIDDRVDTLTGWQTTETTNAPTASNAVWGGSTGTGASTLVGFTHKRAYSSGLEMKNCSVEGLRINANRKHIWIDVGHFLYGFSASIPMSWDHYPTSHTVQFEITTATLGFAVGDRITLPTNNDHSGPNEGMSNFFRLVNADGVNRLRLYIYGHDNLGYITGFGTLGAISETSGKFVVNMTKQGPTF